MESNLTLAPIKNNIIMAKEQYLTKVENAMDSLQVFFYSVIFVLGILGNGLVIWITGFKMAKTVNSIWFLNLAVADFLFSATRCVPLVKNAFFVYWPFGEFLCRANSFLKYLNMFSIPFYIFRGLALDSENRTKCSVTLSIELSKDKEYNKQAIYFHRFITGFLIPFLVILTCYLIIALKLKQRSLGKSRKPFHVILAIVITFFICWTPYHVFLLLKLWGIKGLAMSIGSPLSSSLAYLNSCINPVLYFFMGLNFKMKLNQSLLSVFKRSLLDDLAMSGYSTRRRGETSTNNHLDEWTVTGS